MGENGIPMEYHNGEGEPRYDNGEMLNGVTNGDHKHHSSKHKHKDKNHEKDRRKETEEERRVRKEKEREEREKRCKKEGKRLETEEERKMRKDKERKEREEKPKKEGRREETEEERAMRKEKERREKENRNKNENRREETEEERAIRKERERKEREERHKREGRREETEEERKMRKEKERREKDEKHKNREKDHHNRNHKETEEERRIRKERERRERKGETNDHKIRNKADLDIKNEPEDSQENYTAQSENGEENYKMECDVKEEPQDSEEDAVLEKKVQIAPGDLKRKNTLHSEDTSLKINSCKNKKQKLDSECTTGRYKDIQISNDPPKSGIEGEIKTERTRTVVKERGKVKSEKLEFDNNHDKAKNIKEKNIKKENIKVELTKAENIKEEGIENIPIKVENIKNEDIKEQDIKTGKKGKKVKEEPIVWKWWEDEKKDDGIKWKFLQHKGPVFPPEYQPLPSHVRFYYDRKAMKLNLRTEEVATFYGKMLDHEYTTKDIFNKNFMHDWKKIMSEEERKVIRDLKKCDFSEINAHFKSISEERKNRSKEEKKAELAKNEVITKEYGFCMLDGFEQRIGNFKLEPPGLFRGRGEHPKQGMLKYRLKPENITINCSADSIWPVAPKGHSWKAVQHDNEVTWLAMWQENVQRQFKYVMLNATSKFKGESDMKKYEKARELKKHIDKIRKTYTKELKSREMYVRQRAVATYFIDKLALRAGNEKDEDAADTVGCCSLRVEHIALHEKYNGKEKVVVFDFLGKDSIRYVNEVSVPKGVFKNLQYFIANKKPEFDLFDRLDTSKLNKYLNKQMSGLTAKVFRTYNASTTLQDELTKLTKAEDSVSDKVLSYNRANREVARLCNHQRAVLKTHDQSMENMKIKIDAKKEVVKKAEEDYVEMKKLKKGNAENADVIKKKKALERAIEQLHKLENTRIDKDENKTISLGTSKLNYLDPRISVAWCQKYDVPIEKIYSKTHRQKFQWAIDMTGPDYVF